ncbi:MAG: hypothetical protein WKF75_10785 [Singulisphaera sp.]
MHALTILTAGAAVGLSYAYLVRYRYFVSSVASSACLLCATSPTIIYFADRLLSEMPFALLLVLALWTFDGLLQSPQSSRTRQFVSGLALAAPLLCRSVGVSLIPAFLWIGWRHRRSLRWAYPGMLVIVLPWVLWTIVNHARRRQSHTRVLHRLCRLVDRDRPVECRTICLDQCPFLGGLHPLRHIRC